MTGLVSVISKRNTLTCIMRDLERLRDCLLVRARASAVNSVD